MGRREEDGSLTMDNNLSMDMISQLPQPILHRILSFLSQTEAIQTCVLSKQWRFLGSTRPNLDFVKRNFKTKKDKFLSVVEKTLQRYHDQNLSLREFIFNSLDDEFGEDPKNNLLLERWIPTVLATMGVKILNLSAYQFVMPFQAECLQELYLYHCSFNKINSTEKVVFKNLQKLSLKSVFVDEETLETIISSCPLIECLVKEICIGLETITINKAHSLKHVHCSCGIEIDDPSTIETIRIDYGHNWSLYHHNKYFCHLKFLYLYNVQLDTESFDAFSPTNFPCLREFTLEVCYGFKELRLSNHLIKRLTIVIYSAELTVVSIVAESILYFETKILINCVPTISIKPTPNEWKSHVIVPKHADIINSRSRNLHELLKRLSGSQTSVDISLHPTREGVLVWRSYDEPAVVIEHLGLRGFCFWSSSAPALLNWLFRALCPRYIDIHFCHDMRASEGEICKKFANNWTCDFWIQDLEEIRMLVSDENGDQEWHIFEETSFKESVLTKEQNLCFRLKWKDA